MNYDQEADRKRTAVLAQGVSATVSHFARWVNEHQLSSVATSGVVEIQRKAAKAHLAAEKEADEYRHAASVAASVALHPSSRERHDYNLIHLRSAGGYFVAHCTCGHETGLMPTAGLAGSAHDAHVATVDLGGAA